LKVPTPTDHLAAVDANARALELNLVEVEWIQPHTPGAGLAFKLHD
jgi:hypothetical protein